VTGRSTTVRDQHRNAIKRERPPCGICGQKIDYSLPYLDPMSFVVDHIAPIVKGGTDTLDNKQAAHRLCNNRKYDKSDVDLRPAPRTFVTHREW
jgi:5-methylcytosine-specific restriction endonuclease McrA